MSKNTRNYPKDDEKDLRETIQKLKSQVRKLKKDNKELKSDNESLLDAWAKTEAYLQEITQGVPLEDLLRFRKLPKKALHKKEGKVKKNKEDTMKETKEKWRNWRKENL